MKGCETMGVTAMICIVLVSVSILPVVSCSTKALPAFSHGHVKYFGNNYLLQSSSCLTRRTPSLPQFRPSDVSYTKLYASREKAQSTAAGSTDLDEKEVISYPVQVNHQGHIATISVREGEPILQALERQSTLSNKSKNDESAKTEQKDGNSSLALSQIPHECRRGNCLTCSSRIVESNSNGSGSDATQNILANVDNGLSPTVASELTNSGHILTCCSYVTGPGVVLELDQNDEVWDIVYKQRICNTDSKQIALEAQARLLRRVDEKNVGKWKSKMEKKWGDKDGDL